MLQHQFTHTSQGSIAGANTPRTPQECSWKTLLLVAITLLMAFPASAVAANNGKIEICHLPPGNPENAQTLVIAADALADHLGHGDFEGACPPTAAELDPPSVWVDPDLEPPAPTIAGVNGGPARPLVRMNSDVGRGYQFDFVQDEVYLITDDPADLADFQSRWPSEVLFEIPLPPESPATNPLVIYLLQVDTLGVNTRRLDRDLAGLDPHLFGDHQVSSEAGLRLLAVVAGEIRRHGLRVGINVLLQSNPFSERASEEAMIGVSPASGPLSFAYSSNAFDWPTMERRPDLPGDSLWPLDTGVGEALRSVEAEGRIGNRVRALIADGGFYPNQDFPPYTAIGPLRTTNPDPTGCGNGSPPAPDSTCGTHGTHVLMSGFGLPDNAFGTVGPGGAVTDLVLLQSPSVDFNSILHFIVNSIPDALVLRPDIINLSASVEIPGGWCFIACEPVDLVSEWLYNRSIIFIAAAGNNNIDVDATDEFCTLGCVTFEEAAIIPCETDHVICVGAHTFFESRRTGYSNYGSSTDDNSVDIFAPGDLYSVNAIQADDTTALLDDLQIINGTSFASPFVAGVAALTWASNPALSHVQVRQCLLNTAVRPSLSGERRRVNALGAVSCAMGGTWPWVEISQPLEGASFVRGTQTVTLEASTDDYENGSSLTINWTSSINGSLGSSASNEPRNIGSLALDAGEHEICATVVDSSARDWQDCVNVTVTSASPIVQIYNPAPFQVFIESDTIALIGGSYDPDSSPIQLIRWSFRYSPSTGFHPETIEGTFDTSIPASVLGVGQHWVILTVVDNTGAVGEADPVLIQVIPDPDNLPPVVTINSPTSGSTVTSEGGPVEIELDATVIDAEDGPIPFAQINWFVRLEDGPEQPLTVTRECILYSFLDPTICVLWTPYRFELSPVASNPVTRYRIIGRVQDSTGNTGSAQATVFVEQLI